MFPTRVRYVFLLVICGLGAAPAASAQYDVDSDDRLWLRAVLDLRLVQGPAAPSWTDGGPGKTRYGGRSTDSGFERVTRIELAQLALEFGAALPGDIRARAQVNIQNDIAGDYTPWIVEANLRKEWGAPAGGWGLQAGVMNLPFSLEHTGAAWSPELTISASALNSWLWEDVSLAGVEGEWWKDTQSGLRLGVLAGVGYGPDLFGRLLALRGWAMGDGLGGINGDLRSRMGRARISTMSVTAGPGRTPGSRSATRVSGFALKLGYFDNLGDQDEPGVWHTRVATVGAIFHPHPSVDVIIQALRGKARVQTLTNDSDLRAFYALVSHRYRDHRFTIRYDEFRVKTWTAATRRRARRRHHRRLLLSMGAAPSRRTRIHLANSRRPAISNLSFPRTAGNSAIVSATDRRPHLDRL